MEKILLDTDIGSDIDDALALAYLLQEPECELLGITTVSGQPIERAKLASALCTAAGRSDIPIFPGAEQPFLGKQQQPAVPQAEQLSHWKHQEVFPESEAICFLRDMIRRHPGEITLLAIGPLTNIGLLFAMDREIPSLLKGLVLMCGNFFTGAERPEWNAKCDWVASSVVYNSGVRVHRSFGLNVTLQVALSEEEVAPLMRGNLLPIVRDFSRTWFKRPGQKMIFHDPLAAVGIFEPSVCTYRRGIVEIGKAPCGQMGETRFSSSEDGFCEVAETVDANKFFSRFFQTAGEGYPLRK